MAKGSEVNAAESQCCSQASEARKRRVARLLISSTSGSVPVEARLLRLRAAATVAAAAVA